MVCQSRNGMATEAIAGTKTFVAADVCVCAGVYVECDKRKI